MTGVSDSRPGSEDDAFTSAKTGSELTRGKTEVSINLDKNKNSDLIKYETGCYTTTSDHRNDSALEIFGGKRVAFLKHFYCC